MKWKKSIKCGWIWRKDMFKTQFNSLYVSVMDFVLDEKIEYDFETPEKEIKHYKSVVDEYNVILFNLENIELQLDEGSILYQELVDIKEKLNTSLESYKTKSATVRAYLQELDVLEIKTTFADKLYRFEQSLVSSPLIKIDVEEIQRVLSYAREYVRLSTSFYYYANNPFEIDVELGVIIPIKHSFEKSDELITSVYNYMYGLYTLYLDINQTELESMVPLGTAIEEKIHELIDAFNDAKNNKFYVTFETTSDEYYAKVEEIKEGLTSIITDIINRGVYRFTNLVLIFEPISTNVATFISEYENHSLYTSETNSLKFGEKLEKLAEYITLLEDGKIKIDTQYVLTDITLKDLVEEIIDLSRTVKKKIFYTQQYHESGLPKMLEFEFYQTGSFLSSIKTYYYQLMTNNIYRYSEIGINEFGDSTIDDLRESYKSQLSKYAKFISQETDYLNDFEFKEYYDDVVSLQSKLKVTSATFFDNAIKTSPVTYIDEMEKQYLTFLTSLEQDLSDISSRRLEDILKILDENKIESHDKLMLIESHVKNIENVLDLSKKYTFIGLTEYIDNNIYQPMNNFFINLKDHYRKENYIELLEYYDEYYDENIIDFNMLYAIEKFGKSANAIFIEVDYADDMYVDEYSLGDTILDYQNTVDVLEDLFADETYKVSRNEIFSELDVLYEFVIATRPNEKTFLINEKNLKKLYFDNQFMKINYIRWYHKILAEFGRYNNVDFDVIGDNQFYLDNKTFIEEFSHKGKLEVMILTQNRALSEITKMIVDYASDTNFQNVNFTSEIIRNIDEYNVKILSDFEKMTDIIDKLQNLEKITHINRKREQLNIEHKNQWVDVIVNNNIPVPEKVSYNEFDVFKGAIPFTVELEAKLEYAEDSTGNLIKVEYRWYIGSLIKEGNEISHTFYDEGIHKIRCEITYPSGEVLSRFLEFELSGPGNANVVKFDSVKYAPLEEHPDQPKITYKDPDTGELMTIPLNVTGNILDMIGSGSITVSESDNELLHEKVGVVILGFEGLEFPGEPYDYAKIFDDGDKFEWPEEAEFLFDFKVSTPIAGTSTINIESSRYTTFMAKVPSNIKSVYEIEKASLYQTIGTSVRIDIGDKLIFKNFYDRYAVVEIKNITTFTESAERAEDDIGKYYYSIEFNYFVNTSLNQFDRDEFKPEETSMVIPTLIFKTSVREIFNSLIARLHEIHTLNDQLELSTDTESYETIQAKINELENENKTFYLFEELDKVKAKYFALKGIYDDLSSKYNIDYTLPIDELNVMVDEYNNHINATKTFGEYMCNINAYNFKQNIVDLHVLVGLYKDQKTIIEILLSTYEYKQYSKEYYVENLKLIEMFDTNDFVDDSLAYGPFLVNLVTKLRDLLFRMKLVINYPIMTEGRYFILSELYYRLKEDLSTGEWSDVEEMDLFLLNKKLELKYGYEAGKVETGLPYKEFITELIDSEKTLFGKGLSSDDIRNISNYIQVVESKSVEEYDDFFMIPFWIDYLEKNV